MSSSAPVTPATEPVAAKPKAPVWLYAVIGLVLVAVLGGAGWFVAARLAGPAKPAEPEVRREATVKATLSLGSVVVNIGPPEGRRYLKVGVELGVPGPKDTKEIEEHKAQVLDLLITVLATTPVDALGSEEGRAGLKKTLLTRIREELGLEKVSRVYFTEFILQ